MPKDKTFMATYNPGFNCGEFTLIRTGYIQRVWEAQYMIDNNPSLKPLKFDGLRLAILTGGDPIEK